MVPVDYLNQIAQSQELETPLGRYLFNLESEDELIAYIDQLYFVLCAQGFHPGVASAVIELFPLVLENVAISRFICDTNSIGLRNAMPEILDAKEALFYAIGDHYDIACSDALRNQFIYLMNQFIETQTFLIEDTE